MEKAVPKLTIVWDGKAELGEGPVWDHRSGHLVWVDIYGMKVHRYDAMHGVDQTISLDQQVGAAVPDARGDLILALEHGFHRYETASGELVRLCDPESDKPGNRFNDGKCDGAGRFWAGTMDRREEQPLGALYCLEPDGSVRKALDGIKVSNGLEWSLDHTVLYYIDSPTKRVLAYDFQLDSGELSNPRIVVKFPEAEGFPDGMTIDEEGMLWIAHWDGWQVSRWNPDSGDKIASIPMPVARPTSCVFGGDDYEVLYITSARTGFDAEQLAKQPHAGAVFSCMPGVRGKPSRFCGRESK
jgi:sugar lactone lactonase YvrE